MFPLLTINIAIKYITNNYSLAVASGVGKNLYRLLTRMLVKTLTAAGESTKFLVTILSAFIMASNILTSKCFSLLFCQLIFVATKNSRNISFVIAWRNKNTISATYEKVNHIFLLDACENSCFCHKFFLLKKTWQDKFLNWFFFFMQGWSFMWGNFLCRQFLDSNQPSILQTFSVKTIEILHSNQLTIIYRSIYIYPRLKYQVYISSLSQSTFSHANRRQTKYFYMCHSPELAWQGSTKWLQLKKKETRM